MTIRPKRLKKIPKNVIKNSTAWRPSYRKTGSLDTTNSWYTSRQYSKRRIVGKKREIGTNKQRCKKIAINPTQKQRHLLLGWFELYRIVYNMAVRYKRKDNTFTFRQIRKKIKNDIDANKYLTMLQTKTGVYEHTLNYAVKDVFNAIKTAHTNLRKGHIRYFRLRYKKKNHHLKTMVLEKTTFNSSGKGLKKEGFRDLKPSRPLSDKQDTRMGYNALTKKFTIFMPYFKSTSTTLKREPVCALDPGVRTFQTVYSPSGQTYQFGDENKLISKDIKRIEKVSCCKNRSWYKKYTNRLRNRIQNRVAEMHWKISNFLCKNYDNVLVGNMSTTGITKKSLNLHSSTKRLVYALSHYTFKERLQSKAAEYNCNVKIVDESYTSKTCGKCGEILETLGSSKIFQCDKNCRYKMHRDIHGARNIYLKNKSKVKAFD